jgi:hypothetical protein
MQSQYNFCIELNQDPHLSDAINTRCNVYMILVLNRRQSQKLWPGVVGTTRVFFFQQEGVCLMIVLPFLPKGAIPTMDKDRNTKLKPRSIHLPTWLWDELDKDAKRCGRSATKQLEILLTLCYVPNAKVEVDTEAITSAYQVASHKRLKKAG